MCRGFPQCTNVGERERWTCRGSPQAVHNVAAQGHVGSDSHVSKLTHTRQSSPTHATDQLTRIRTYPRCKFDQYDNKKKFFFVLTSGVKAKRISFSVCNMRSTHASWAPMATLFLVICAQIVLVQGKHPTSSGTLSMVGLPLHTETRYI